MSATPPAAPTTSPSPTPSPVPATSTHPPNQPTKSVGAGVWLTAISIIMGSSYLILSEYLKSTPEGAKSYQAQLDVHRARFDRDVALANIELKRLELEIRRLELTQK